MILSWLLSYDNHSDTFLWSTMSVFNVENYSASTR